MRGNRSSRRWRHHSECRRGVFNQSTPCEEGSRRFALPRLPVAVYTATGDCPRWASAPSGGGRRGSHGGGTGACVRAAERRGERGERGTTATDARCPFTATFFTIVIVIIVSIVVVVVVVTAWQFLHTDGGPRNIPVPQCAPRLHGSPSRQPPQRACPCVRLPTLTVPACKGGVRG